MLGARELDVVDDGDGVGDSEERGALAAADGERGTIEVMREEADSAETGFRLSPIRPSRVRTGQVCQTRPNIRT